MTVTIRSIEFCSSRFSHSRQKEVVGAGCRCIGASCDAPNQEPYLQRTEWNVRDSDATVLFSIESIITGGSKKTVEFALEHNKPWLHLWEHKRRGGWIFLRLERKVVQAMKRKRPRVIVLDPKDLERRCAAAKVTGRQFLSTLEPEEAQTLAPVFPKGCAVHTTDLIGVLESELEEIKPCGVVRI
jgi:Circularly permutated YpsA SLOG family